jgi:hypothetical protein
LDRFRAHFSIFGIRSGLYDRDDLLAQLTHQGPGFNYNKEHIAMTGMSACQWFYCNHSIFKINNKLCAKSSGLIARVIQVKLLLGVFDSLPTSKAASMSTRSDRVMADETMALATRPFLILESVTSTALVY